MSSEVKALERFCRTAVESEFLSNWSRRSVATAAAAPHRSLEESNGTDGARRERREEVQEASFILLYIKARIRSAFQLPARSLARPPSVY